MTTIYTHEEWLMRRLSLLLSEAAQMGFTFYTGDVPITQVRVQRGRVAALCQRCGEDVQGSQILVGNKPMCFGCYGDLLEG